MYDGLCHRASVASITVLKQCVCVSSGEVALLQLMWTFHVGRALRNNTSFEYVNLSQAKVSRTSRKEKK